MAETGLRHIKVADIGVRNKLAGAEKFDTIYPKGAAKL